MTAAEARGMADNFSAGRWNPVIAASQCLEEQALRQAHGFREALIKSEFPCGTWKR